ncbi:hypothetical protein SKTS_02870 [Sulfurimicrobium lacus]|uniref:MSHA biogenesis protein MshP n=1 Tax=Sulfurimicrobium lacus TaxID=2715678 RepID=A0A6F8V8E4_9PROT|nr:hypothetical protein SKTS_02870 [Sulfurimicrobium lacus]
MPVSRQQGFTMVSAIFLLVVLAALGAFMLTFSSVQHTTATTDIQGSRAYQAARAGIEWAAFQVLDPAGASVVAPTNPAWPNFPACPAGPFPVAGFAGTNLAGFAVTVACVRSDHTEGSMNVVVYQLTSTATGGAGSYAVTRVINTSVSKCRNPDAPAPYEC